MVNYVNFERNNEINSKNKLNIEIVNRIFEK
jgi:hypothetical protein